MTVLAAGRISNICAESESPTGRVEPDGRLVAGAIAASIGGTLVHNLAEFPPSILLGPETLVPVGITLLLGVAMLRSPTRGVFLAAAGWAAIVAVVGGGSVLPLSVLPFTPDQTVGHYAAHVVYALAQVPLLWVALRGVRRSSSLE
ncbi:hypothetical protein [Natrononativus amylolyticus]|uniref:hypothetical protein n=1 Tax=Natrononativus amylolyticus TaxID=2963434 RepID=UPI0020CE586A|nr:hypothetical protein [Natrononativus amylolyticus]